MRMLFLVLVLILAHPVLAQDDPPFSELTGIPVMEGLSEDIVARLVFDKPEGRIIEARFGGDVLGQDVMAFYRETLFQLGWVLDSGESGNMKEEFSREGERLSLAITNLEPLEVTLELGPSGEDEAG